MEEMRDTEHTPVFNTLVLYEKVQKNRIKNLKALGADIVPLDEKKKLNKYVHKRGIRLSTNCLN